MSKASARWPSNDCTSWSDKQGPLPIGNLKLRFLVQAWKPFVLRLA